MLLLTKLSCKHSKIFLRQTNLTFATAFKVSSTTSPLQEIGKPNTCSQTAIILKYIPAGLYISIGNWDVRRDILIEEYNKS
jgi:hypothetical protein